VDNNHLDLGMSKSGFIHTLPSGRLRFDPLVDSDGFDPLWCKSPNGPQML
jgi:hypothetical protein